jgi:ATP-dependent Lhr-like helicase
MPLNGFHPAVAAWFEKQFAEPTEPQAKAWPAIKSGRHTLIAAPTGSGKTLAAFLSAIDDLVRQSVEGTLEDATQVVYVSPLKALSNDIQCNLQVPLEGVRRELEALGVTAQEIRTLVRTGDTPASERTRMTKRPPHVIVTTPESLFILLTSEGGRRMLGTARTLIVDEIHAIVGTKRGAHLALSIERLEALVGTPLVRIGLSATQRPIEEVARFLVGTDNSGIAARSAVEPSGMSEVGQASSLSRGGVAAEPREAPELVEQTESSEYVEPAERAELVGQPKGQAGSLSYIAPDCTIVDSGHVRKLDLAIEVPKSPLESVMSGEVWDEVYDRLAELIIQHRSTLVFVNTRRMSERICRHLGERVGPENITSHHGSLAKEKRLNAEQRLKRGDLRALVATASLELGIDIGAVDLVCQIGSTRSIATLLQRVGRSGHQVSGIPKGRLFPTSRDELVECAALLDSVRRGELDQLTIPEQPLDILAQQIVAAVATGEWTEDDLYNTVLRAYPYRNLARADFDSIVSMLAEGFTTRRGRRSAYLHRDAVNKRLRGRRGAGLAAMTSGGAIPDTADYQVILQPGETPIGTVNEDFAIESMQGDIFQLGNASWRILRVEPGKVRVEDAQGLPPSIPFWLGEAPGRTQELSNAVSRLRIEVSDRLSLGAAVPEEDWFQNSAPRAVAWLEDEAGISRPAAEQIVMYLAASQAALGTLPNQTTIVIERFFDETGGTQLVIHSPFGSRLNRAWGLALRKRFCRKFNFELQAAATEDAIVISLSPVHSFPLDDVSHYLRSRTVREVLTQALLDAPMFAIRWRWSASRALAVLRWSGGRKVPAQIQRIQAEDLLAAVFPDQVACAENLTGEREIPDHPLVRQSIRDCLEEAMDIEALEALLGQIENGTIQIVTRELTEPSPLAQEILNARPYAFLDDAPLEERRTQAVMSRRWLDPQTASDLGKLDQAAIDRVREESWPQAETADELHDALLQLGFLQDMEGRTGLADWQRTTSHGPSELTETASRPGRDRDKQGWSDYLELLSADSRAAVMTPYEGGPALWVAAERLPHLLALFPRATTSPPISAPDSYQQQEWTFEKALVEILRGRLEAEGPVTSVELARKLGLGLSDVEAGLAGLEAEGFILRGTFTPGSAATEWCVRRLLSRIHSYTLNRLRKEVEPVAVSDFMRFLFDWQRVSAEHRAESQESLAGVIEQLEGFEAPAAAWEADVLPARMVEYDPAWLDALCLSGRMAWLRLTPPRPASEGGRSSGPVKNSPISLLRRKSLDSWAGFSAAPDASALNLSHLARDVYEHLVASGASFFADIVDGTGLLRAQVEDALGELVSWGLVTADSFTGLRALLTPSDRRPVSPGTRRRHRTAAFGMESAGRWALTRRGSSGVAGGANGAGQAAAEPHLEKVAYSLLRRYGVVMRKLLDREGLAPPWRDLLRVYRRLEARGEIRGGRFVGGFSGEQFALPEAVGMLRTIRRTPKTGELVSVSAADPLNLVGVMTPGGRVSSLPSNRILFRDGEPIAILEGGRTTLLVELAPAAEWEARNALVRRRVPPQLREYLGQLA